MSVEYELKYITYAFGREKRNWLGLEEGIVLSPWKTRQIKGALEIQHYKVFEDLRIAAEAAKSKSNAEPVPPVNQQDEGAQAASEAQESSESKE